MTDIHNETKHPSRAFAGDFNGDGRDDFLLYWRGTNGNGFISLYTGGVNGMRTAVHSYPSQIYQATEPIMVGDVNGDGCDDLIIHAVSSYSTRQIIVYQGSTASTFAGKLTATENTHDQSIYPTKLLVADINGDGRSDFVSEWCTATFAERIYVYRGTVSSTFLNIVSTDINLYFFTYA